jgi:magnesium transporter
MARLFKPRAKKVGQPPGTLIYIGEKAKKTTSLTLIQYSEDHYEETKLPKFDHCLILDDPQTVTWLNVNGLSHIAGLEKLGECFGLHPLVLEDILNTDQHPKMEDYGDYLYLVLRLLEAPDGQEGQASNQLSLILGKNFVITLHEAEEDLFAPIRERLKARGRIRRAGADFLAYALVDLIVDQYFLIMERLGEVMEDLEEELVDQPSPPTLHRIHTLKRETILLRRSVWPLREVLSRLQRRESPLIRESTGVYFKDVYDHVIQVMDSIETVRDMLSGMLDVYLSSVSHRLNEIMKVLTIIATIFIPLTFISGLYGMNLEGFFPPKEVYWGFGSVVAISLLLGISMLFWFRKKGWF